MNNFILLSCLLLIVQLIFVRWTKRWIPNRSATYYGDNKWGTRNGKKEFLLYPFFDEYKRIQNMNIFS